MCVDIIVNLTVQNDKLEIKTRSVRVNRKHIGMKFMKYSKLITIAMS